MEEAVDADRVIVMDDGEIVADSTPKDIFSNIKLLKEVGLDVPQTTELLYRLKLGGLNISHYQTLFLLYAICIVFAAALLIVVPAIFPKGEYHYSVPTTAK
jgi:hypothetical protein